MSARSAALEAVDLHFSYGPAPVLDGVDLGCVTGELLGVVGPNGAGKTTLLRLFSGTLKPDRGRVRVGGIDIAGLRPRERAKLIAMVPQGHASPQGFTALEMVLMGRNPHLGLLQWEGRRDVEVALRALALTGARDFADRLMESLSGGEQQRVIIARALAQEAPVLLLDEPTAHLDIGYQAGVFDAVRAIKAEAGVTVVAAIHDLTLAAQYCDRVAVLYTGTIAALGRPKEVLTAEVVSRAFGAEVCVIEHPQYGTPVVLHGRRESV